MASVVYACCRGVHRRRLRCSRLLLLICPHPVYPVQHRQDLYCSSNKFRTEIHGKIYSLWIIHGSFIHHCRTFMMSLNPIRDIFIDGWRLSACLACFTSSVGSLQFFRWLVCILCFHCFISVQLVRWTSFNHSTRSKHSNHSTESLISLGQPIFHFEMSIWYCLFYPSSHPRGVKWSRFNDLLLCLFLSFCFMSSMSLLKLVTFLPHKPM